MKFRMKAVLSMLVVVLMLLVGCGISQEQYNTVITERETAKVELQSITNELSIYESKVEEQKKAMATARTFVDVISSLFVPILKGEATTETELAELGVSWLISIHNVDDEVAKGLFAECVNSNFAEQEMLDLFLYIFEALPKTLE
ncbi:hypothetical protein ACFLVG_06255 [Chloroflexota bacterium]